MDLLEGYFPGEAPFWVLLLQNGQRLTIKHLQLKVAYGLFSIMSCCQLYGATTYKLINKPIPLELIYYFTYFPPSSHLTLVCFFRCYYNIFNGSWSFFCELPKSGDRRNIKTRWKCCINNERRTGNKHTLDGKTVKYR